MRLGELDANEFFRHYLVRVDGIARKHGGRLLKRLGDSFLAIFDTAQNAVAFTLDLCEVPGQELAPVKPPIQTRLAVHTGPIAIRHTQYGDDVVGEAVVVAVRLAEIARPGQIILSSTVANSLPKNYFKQPIRQKEIMLKGVAETVNVTVVDAGGEISSNGKSKQAGHR